MARASLTLSSKNYSSWSFRGWLMVKFAGIEFDEIMTLPGDEDARAEILLLSPSILVPCLTFEGIRIWDTLAIGEFVNEVAPHAGLLPRERAQRALCRSICGEMHSGFVSLRSALPMNIKARFENFRIWSKAKSDIERVCAIWRDCLSMHHGDYLFGAFSMADAMYAPVVTRFRTYGVKLDEVCERYCEKVLAHPLVGEWIAGALKEEETIEELEVEF